LKPLHGLRYDQKKDTTQNLMRIMERISDLVEHVKALETVLETKLEEETEAFKALRKLYFQRYRQKAHQLTGADNVTPQWNGKEGSLLKNDIVSHGGAVIERYLEYFFSDQIPEVAEFTRYKAKAGYGYAVFHGVIAKMTMYQGKPKKPCSECGQWGQHRPSCSLKPKYGTDTALPEDIEATRAETAVLDISGMFREKTNARAE
jgi:hypothetical protein